MACTINYTKRKRGNHYKLPVPPFEALALPILPERATQDTHAGMYNTSVPLLGNQSVLNTTTQTSTVALFLAVGL